MGHKGRCDLPFFSSPPLQRLLKKQASCTTVTIAYGLLEVVGNRGVRSGPWQSRQGHPTGEVAVRALWTTRRQPALSATPSPARLREGRKTDPQLISVTSWQHLAQLGLGKSCTSLVLSLECAVAHQGTNVLFLFCSKFCA